MGRSIVITGASSGIGAALAEHLAADGVALNLGGMHADRLAVIAARCRAKGAQVDCRVCDVRHHDDMAQWLGEVDQRRPVDLLIANAGVLAGAPGGEDGEPGAVAREVVAVNAIGVVNTVAPLADAMARRGHGQIAIVSSMAAFTPHPDWPAYCASKAAASAYGLSLRQRLHGRGVKVSVVCPGWVDTAMNAGFAMWRPMQVSADDAARAIIRGLARDKAVIAFPRAVAWLGRASGLLPEQVTRRVNLAFRARRRGGEE